MIAQVLGGVELIGVLSTDAAAERNVLLVTIPGCHNEPCRIVKNLTRGDAAAFEDDLREKLRHALMSHLPESRQ